MATKIEIGPYSAYAIAVKYGYEGTEEDWIKEVEADRTRAETAVSNALASENAAKTSEQAAKESENNAAASATEADNAKTAAQTSETNAQRSAAAAAASAELAGSRASTDKTLDIENTPADSKAVGDALARKIDKSSIKFWVSPDPTSPALLFGGTWERIEGRMIIGASDQYPAGSTGGSATHTQTTDEMPVHSHGGSTASAGDHSHSGSTASAGAHTHSGTTKSAGAHYHLVSWTSDADGSGSEASDVMDYNKGWYTSKTSSAGDHTHTFTTGSSGAHTHTVTIDNNGAHTHTVTINSTGGGQAMDILNPYHALYMWVRVEDDAA